MAIHKENRRLCYLPEKLFGLVAKVELYPEFLPLWKDVSVSQGIQHETGHTVYYTDQVIQLGPLRKRFRTQTTLIPFHSIHVISSDPMFRKFSINWIFKPDRENGCLIEFTLDCVASSVLLRPVFDVALLEAGRSIVSAFENRARSIYGH